MKTHFSNKAILYDGKPLSSLWAFKNFDLQGDSIVSFVGPCKVGLKELVDVADVKANAPIYSKSMLNFIVEHFDMDLEKAIWKQRLLTCQALELFRSKLKNPVIRREGNDLYEGDAKISVSIATLSPVSSKIHFGINVISKGTPVKTKGLADYKLDPRLFAEDLMQKYAAECADVLMDRAKVRAVP
jgi:hypothetical protein